MLNVNRMAFIAAVGLAAVSATFSIVGLTALFAASVVAVAIMGAALEVSKLVTAAWLHHKWQCAGRLLRFSLTAMVLVLMAITSMGTFGFLTKAHIDHQTTITNVVDGDAVAIQGKIAARADAIADLNRRIGQIDAAIEAANKKGQSKTAVQLIEQQKKARGELADKRKVEADALSALNVTKAGADAKARKLEAEVGPVAYLAKLLGYDVEQAVRMVTTAIVLVFDPLAVLLMLAATGRRVYRPVPAKTKKRKVRRGPKPTAPAPVQALRLAASR